MGVAIAIDDFGTGFSSLTQLQQLPVDEIKIDKSFVINYESSAHDAAIVRSTVDLGRNLGVQVTAEGVESESVYRELGRLGCDFAQGFHLAPPMEPQKLVLDAFKASVEPATGRERRVIALDDGEPSLPQVSAAAGAGAVVPRA